MYTHVFVIVPISVAPENINRTSLAALAKHEADGEDQTLEARFDRRSGFRGTLEDQEAFGLLPARDKRALQGRIAFIRNLSHENVPAALVLPSGAWHDRRDYGWTMMGEQHVKERAWASWQDFYFQALSNHLDDYVVEAWVHS
jgi:hypothetical protein